MDDQLASGLTHSTCTYTDELLRVPELVYDAIATDPVLRAVASTTIRAMLRQHQLNAEQLDEKLTVEAFANMILNVNWQEGKGLFLQFSVESVKPRHGATSDFLRLRVDALQMLLLLIPETYFIKQSKMSLQQMIVMWMSAHVPLYIFLESKSCRAFSDSEIPASRFPHMRMSLGPHILPRMHSVILDLDFFNNVTILKSQYENCLLHIMSKALPRRCQIRELARFMLKYIELHPTLAPIFSRMLLLSLLNLYPMRTDHTTRMQGDGFATPTETKQACGPNAGRGPSDFKLITKLYATFYLDTLYPSSDADQQNSTTPSLLRILQLANNKSYTAQCQALFFFIIREFLVYEVQQLPALRVVLNISCSWQCFENSVADNMHSMRVYWATKLNKRGGVHTGSASTGGPLVFNEQVVIALMRFAQSHMNKGRFCFEPLVRNKLVDTLESILAVYNTHFETRLAGGNYPSYATTLHAAQEDVARSGSECLGLFDRILPPTDTSISENTRGIVFALFRKCHSTTDPTHLQPYLEQLHDSSPLTYMRMLQILMIAHGDLLSSVHNLPTIMWAAQMSATERVWERIGGVEANPQANTLLVCQGCMEIKTDFLGRQQKGATSFVIPTHGSVDVTVDDNSNQLICSSCNSTFSLDEANSATTTIAPDLPFADCTHAGMDDFSRRRERQSGAGNIKRGKKRVIAQSKSVRRVRTSKTKLLTRTNLAVSSAKVMRCINFPLVRTHLIGNVVVHLQTMYTICTNCACVTEIVNLAEQAPLLCMGCAAAKKKAINVLRMMQYDERKKGVECGACSRFVAVTKEEARSRHVAFYSDDLFEPLLWLPLCHACAKSYKQMKRGGEPQLVSALEQYRILMKSRQDANYLCLQSTKSTKRGRIRL